MRTKTTAVAGFRESNLDKKRLASDVRSSMAKHWVFDFDGTLVNTDGFFSESIAYALDPFGKTVGPNFIEEIRHKHPTQIFDHLLTEREAKEALARLGDKGKELAERTPLFDGIESTLLTLANKGCRISIWTGRDRKSAVHILEKTGIKKYFDRIVSGTCVPNNKPQVDGLLELSSHFAVGLDQLAVVGDHHHDIAPANDLGCFSIHAQWKDIPHALPEGLEAKKSFDCVDKFHSWIKLKNP